MTERGYQRTRMALYINILRTSTKAIYDWNSGNYFKYNDICLQVYLYLYLCTCVPVYLCTCVQVYYRCTTGVLQVYYRCTICLQVYYLFAPLCYLNSRCKNTTIKSIVVYFLYRNELLFCVKYDAINTMLLHAMVC